MAVNHPRFRRPNVGRSSRSKVKDVWRRPRGTDNKLRTHIRYMGASPAVGWRGKKEERDIHPSGYKEVRVFCLSDVKALDGQKVAVRISGNVSKKNKPLLVKTAKELGLKVLNPKVD